MSPFSQKILFHDVINFGYIFPMLLVFHRIKNVRPEGTLLAYVFNIFSIIIIIIMIIIISFLLFLYLK